MKQSLKRWPAIIFTLLLVLGVAAAWALSQLPTWVRDKAVKELTFLTGRTVAIGKIELGLFPPGVTISDFKVLDDKGSIATFSLARLSTEIAWQSIAERYPIVKSLRIEKPEINLTRFADGKTSADDLIERFQNRPKSDELPKFSVANIAIESGAVRVNDELVKSSHSVTELNVQLPFISSLPVNQKVWIKPALSLKLDDRKIEGLAESLPFDGSHKSRLTLAIEPFELAPWLAYWPKTAVMAPKEARLQSKLAIDFEQGTKTSLLIKGQVEVENIKLRQAITTAVFEKLEIDIANVKIDAFELEPLAQQFKAQGIVVKEPSVVITRPASSAATKPKGAAEPAPTFNWQLGDVKLVGGTVAYQDPLFSPKPLKVKLANVEGSIAGLGIDAAIPVAIKATAQADQGELLKVDGTFHKEGGRSQLAWEFDKASLSQWWWLVEPFIVSTPKGGTAQGKGRVFFGAEQAIKLDQVALSVTDFSLRSKSGLDWLKLASLNASDVALDMATHSVSVSKIDSKRLQIHATRNAQGDLSFSELIPAKRDVPPKTQTGAQAGWSVLLSEVKLDNAFFDLLDAGKAAAKKETDLRIDGIKLLAKNLQLNTDQSFTSQSHAKLNKPLQEGFVDLSASINQKGKLALKGPLQLQPFSTKAQIDVSSVSVLPFQAYFAEYVNAVATSGDVSAKGLLNVNSASSNSVQYQGSAAVGQFASVTKEANDDLLKWKSLNFANVQFATLPLSIDLGDIEVSDFYSRLIINPQGRFNLQDIAAKKSGGEDVIPNTALAPTITPTTVLAAERLPVRIGKITLANGNIDFSDFFVKPNYSANLTNMSGTISELTPEKAGQVNLAGRVDGTGSLSIDGSINPLIRSLFLDLKADARDIDLPRLTPYSGKYIGYGIEKGKLSAKVAYKLENRQLQAQNRVILDQLTFGEKVDSPTAMKLPILFAVALLKDRNGVIDINMPIGGSLDDPQFSISGLVFRMIGNLIVKVITSPFTLLASLGGGKQQELSQIEFEAGKALLTKNSLEKAESVAKALTDRPALKLDIGGRANAVDDAATLKKTAFDRLLKVQKMRETIKGNQSVDEVDAIEIMPSEYAKYLNAAYQFSSVPKQRNLIGIQKTLPTAELEKLLADSVKVSDADVLNLANKRAQALKDWLAETGKITAERLYIVAPKIDGAPRVELGLK